MSKDDGLRERLAEALDAGDEAAVIAMARGLPESRRRPLGAFVSKRLVGNGRTTLPDRAETAATLAFGPRSSFSSLSLLSFPADTAADILTDRDPPWLGEWAEGLSAWRAVDAEEVLHALSARGALGEEARANEVLRRVEEDVPRSREIYVNPATDGSGAVRVTEDPFADEATWRVIFEIEGSQQAPISSKLGRWLVSRVASGELDRARVLDSTVAAMERDFHPNWAPFYAELHELLQPTLDELAARAERYAGVVASRTTATATCALDALGRLEEAGRLETRHVAAAAARSVNAKAKTTRRRVTKLVGRMARRDPAAAGSLLRASAALLLDPDLAVAEAVMELVEEDGDRGDEEFVALVLSARESVSATLRPRLDAWLGPATSTSIEAPAEDDDLLARARALDEESARRCGVDRALRAYEHSLPVEAIPCAAGPHFPTLRESERLTPIATIDELVRTLSRLIDASRGLAGFGTAPASDLNGDAIELALDGLARLCDQRPPDFAACTAALASQALDVLVADAIYRIDVAGWPGGEERVNAWIEAETAKRQRDLSSSAPKPPGRDLPAAAVGVSISADLAQAALAWIHSRDLVASTSDSGSKGPGVARSDPLARALSRRTLLVAGIAARGKAAPLLTAPTHAGGWIDPVIWVERLKERTRVGVAVTRIEIVHSLLRLGFERRAQALRALDGLAGEASGAARYAFGAAGIAPPSHASIAVAAARARAPLQDDPAVESAFPGLGPDAGLTARVGWGVVRQEDGARPGYVMSGSGFTARLSFDPPIPDKVDFTHPSLLVGTIEASELARALRDAWFAAVWPQARETLLSRAAQACVTWLDARCHAPRAWLEVLFDPSVPMMPMALRAIGFGLCVKDPAIHGLVADAVIAAIEDGRIDGPTLERALAEPLATECVTPARIVHRLSDVARVSPLHGQVVRIALDCLLPKLVHAPPAALVAALELLHELCTAQAERPSDETRPLLDGIGKGKAGDRARRLLALPSGSSGARREAARVALAGRLARAESGPPYQPETTTSA